MDENMRAALALLIDKWQRKLDLEATEEDGSEESQRTAARDSGFQIGKEQCARELQQFLMLLS